MKNTKKTKVVPNSLEDNIRKAGKRWFTLFAISTGIFLFLYAKYSHHLKKISHYSILDFPSDIKTDDTVQLANFTQTVYNQYQLNKKLYYPIDPIEHITNDEDILSSPLEELLGHNSVGSKMGIAFPPDYLKQHSRPPKRIVQKCPIDSLHYQHSIETTFSPEQYQSLDLVIKGIFSSGEGEINMMHSNDDVIRFKLTLYSDQEDVDLTQINWKQYSNDKTQVKRMVLEQTLNMTSCLVYRLNILFPESMHQFKQFMARIDDVHRISGDLDHIQFQKFQIGLGRGAIQFNTLKANEIMLSSLKGIVLGDFYPEKKFTSSVLKGATNIKLLPQSKLLDAVIVTLNGPVTTSIKKTDYYNRGEFITHCWFCEPKILPSTLDSYYKRYNLKSGYFKNKSNSKIILHSKHGEVKLIYDDKKK